jgi:antitoxin (DNA-binding transcriptional repressor) of toxin-antitoxin stability system
MTKSLSVRAARVQLTRIDELLEQEREIIITRRGKPIARLVAVDLAQRRKVPSHAQLRAKIKHLERATQDLVREERDER